MDACDILKLSELLKPKREDESESEDELELANEANKGIGPTDIGKKSTSVYAKKLKPEKQKTADPLDPDNEDALYFEDVPEARSDWRKTPQWDVSYKQKVTASDIFLQMSGKNPSTASCEDMIVTVHLPEEDRLNIDLKVTKDRINLVSPKFRLDVPLPQPVDPKLGNAQWDKDAEKLIVTLRMNREFDYVNF